MTTAIRSALGLMEPRAKGSSNLRNDKEISSFKERLAESRLKAAGWPALARSPRSLLEPAPLAAPAEGLARSGCGCEKGVQEVREEPTSEREKRGDAKTDDRRSPDRLAASAGSGAFIEQLVPMASGVGQAEPALRFGAGPLPFAELWARLVRRVALGGDGRRATARIEIGAGEWAGAAIVVHAVEREITLEIDLPAGARVEAWRERIADRLRERGLELSELIVR